MPPVAAVRNTATLIQTISAVTALAGFTPQTSIIIRSMNNTRKTDPRYASLFAIRAPSRVRETDMAK